MIYSLIYLNSCQSYYFKQSWKFENKNISLKTSRPHLMHYVEVLFIKTLKCLLEQWMNTYYNILNFWLLKQITFYNFTYSRASTEAVPLVICNLIGQNLRLIISIQKIYILMHKTHWEYLNSQFKIWRLIF